MYGSFQILNTRYCIPAVIIPVNNLLSDLNSDQRKAVTFGDGPLLILAGAGSGKTRCLTYRVAWLMSERHIPASRILLLTFTNKAAGEMKERVKRLLLNYQLSTINYQLPWAGTFHSWCAWLLRRHSGPAGLKPEWVIYDEDDRLQLIKDIVKDLDLPVKKLRPGSVVAAISSAKNEMITAIQYYEIAKGEWQEGVARVYLEYQKRLKQFGALDFDDLLLETVQMFDREPALLTRYQEQIEYLLIDEYQDTNAVQYKLTRQLAGRRRNLTVVGDMAQSIYTFRGANFRNLMNLKRDFPDLTEIRLERNYRSHQSILDAAHHVIRNNTQHPILKLWTDRPAPSSGGQPKLYAAMSELSEAQFLITRLQEDQMRGLASRSKNGFSLKNYAVLYRTNAQSRVFEEALLSSGIPYTLVGGIRFYQRAEIKDCLAYLRLLYNPDDKVSETRVLKIGQKRYEKFREYATKISSESEHQTRSGDARRGAPQPGVPTWVDAGLSSGRTRLATRHLLDGVLTATDYLSRFDEKDPDDQVRIENVKELLSVAENYPDLGNFLEQVALIEDLEVRQSDDRDTVTLMTLHAAKGLEFPVVFLVGLEEGLLPHSRSLLRQEDLEEERRLMYVGITRAMDDLYLTYARSRLYFGSRGVSIPSRFIGEIGDGLERL